MLNFIIMTIIVIATAIQHCDNVIADQYTGMSDKRRLSQVYGQIIGEEVKVKVKDKACLSITFDKAPTRVINTRMH